MLTKRFVLTPLLFVICACGGGGGSSSPPPVNQPPSFTSAAATNIAENIAVAYQALASDPEGQALRFSLLGGTDAALFDVSAAGELSFRQPPSFETPRDANGDNVYEVTIAVSDGGNSRSQAVAITVTNSREGVVVSRSATLFDQPVAASPIVGSNDILVAERNGGIWRYNPVTESRTQIVALRLPGVPDFALVAIAARPDFATSSRMIVAASGSGVISLYDTQPGLTLVRELTFASPFLSLPYPDAVHRTVALSYDDSNAPFCSLRRCGRRQ